jgi:hypothetical protein
MEKRSGHNILFMIVITWNQMAKMVLYPSFMLVRNGKSIQEYSIKASYRWFLHAAKRIQINSH